jgi:hypothetical protein
VPHRAGDGATVSHRMGDGATVESRVAIPFYFYLILLIISAAAKPRMLPVTRPVTDNTGR